MRGVFDLSLFVFGSPASEESDLGGGSDIVKALIIVLIASIRMI